MKNIFLLGIVSFLNDISSELILAVLPFFLSELGGSSFSLGIIAGVRELLSNGLKVVSGYFSDKFRKKPLIIGGYTLSALFKLTIAFSKTPTEVLLSSSLERLGKGLRTAPRDALISFTKRAGKGFGIHRSLDTLGALVGALSAYYLITYLNLPYRNIILIGAIISFFSLPFLFLLKEETSSKKGKQGKSPQNNKTFIKYIAVNFLFKLGFFSPLLFLLYLKNISNEKTAVLFYAYFNLVSATFSYIGGLISDKLKSKRILALSYTLYGVFLLTLELKFPIPISFLLYGAANGISESVERKFVKELSQRTERGTHYGIFHFVSGTASFLSNTLGGFLWGKALNVVLLTATFLSFTSALLLLKLDNRVSNT